MSAAERRQKGNGLQQSDSEQLGYHKIARPRRDAAQGAMFAPVEVQ